MLFFKKENFPNSGLNARQKLRLNNINHPHNICGFPNFFFGFRNMHLIVINGQQIAEILHLLILME